MRRSKSVSERSRLQLVRATVWTRIKQLLLVIYSLCVRVRVVGRITVPLRKGFIVAANHLNGADSVILQIALRTRLFFAASSRWFRGPFSRFVMRHICDAFPVETGKPWDNVGGVRRCMEVLRLGGCVGIYPEGTFNLSGQVRDIKDGAAYLAARTGAPVLPVYIRNLRYAGRVDQTTVWTECWTGFLSVAENLFNTEVEVLVGDPIYPRKEFSQSGPCLRAEVQRINAEMRQKFEELARFADRPEGYSRREV